MSGFTAKIVSSRPGSPDRSPALPDQVLRRSKIIRNGKVVWLYSKTS